MEKHLCGFRSNNWLIMIFYETKYLGHEVNIRYNSHRECMEFVDRHGDVVDFIRRGNGQEVLWNDFNFQDMDQFFLFSYRDGIREWGIKKIHE